MGLSTLYALLRSSVFKTASACVLSYCIGAGTMKFIDHKFPPPPPPVPDGGDRDLADGGDRDLADGGTSPDEQLRRAFAVLVQARKVENQAEQSLQAACSAADSEAKPRDGGTSPDAALPKDDALVKLNEAIKDLRLANEEIIKCLNLKEPSPALKKTAQEVTNDLQLVCDRVNRTQAVDDIHTAALKARLKTQHDQYAAAELGQTRYGRLSVLVEDAREPLDRLSVKIPVILNTLSKPAVEPSNTAQFVHRQEKDLSTMVEIARRLSTSTQRPPAVEPATRPNYQNAAAELSICRANADAALKDSQDKLEALLRNRGLKAASVPK
jgi:hypothetical protein